MKNSFSLGISKRLNHKIIVYRYSIKCKAGPLVPLRQRHQGLDGRGATHHFYLDYVAWLPGSQGVGGGARPSGSRNSRRIRNSQFFGQVFIDYGAVAWPGEIDLAPDAMYAQIAGRRGGL